VVCGKDFSLFSSLFTEIFVILMEEKQGTTQKFKQMLKSRMKTDGEHPKYGTANPVNQNKIKIKNKMIQIIIQIKQQIKLRCLKIKSKLITGGEHAGTALVNLRVRKTKKQMASMPDTAAVNLCVRITHHAVSTLVAAPVLLYTCVCVCVCVCVCMCIVEYRLLYTKPYFTTTLS